MGKDAQQWTQLCNLDVIPEGASKGFNIYGHNIFAVKQQGNIFVYRNSCPHLGINLEWIENQFLDNSSTMIQCANHGALFLVESGKCVAGPCAGRKLQAVAHKIDGDNLFVSVHQ